MVDPLFRFEGVDVELAGRTVLRGISVDLPDCGITVIAGPSGAGKSTLLRLCNRLEVPTNGRVLFRGTPVGTLDPLSLRRRVGMVFQRPVLFGGTVRDNLLVAQPRAEDEHLHAVLERAALDVRLLDRPATELSGGEAQRACLARTLVTEPDVLLLDEPTSALDAAPRLAFERLVRQLAGAGVPALWVTHDEHQRRRLADHLMVLERGRLAFAGEPGAGRDAS